MLCSNASNSTAQCSGNSDGATHYSLQQSKSYFSRASRGTGLARKAPDALFLIFVAVAAAAFFIAAACCGLVALCILCGVAATHGINTSKRKRTPAAAPTFAAGEGENSPFVLSSFYSFLLVPVFPVAFFYHLQLCICIISSVSVLSRRTELRRFRL